MENSEIIMENPVTAPEEPTEQTVTELVTSLMETETETNATECLTLQPMPELDVDQLNTFTYLGTGFILGCVLVFGLKICYRFFRIFF